jgi:hypothetical protein
LDKDSFVDAKDPEGKMYRVQIPIGTSIARGKVISVVGLQPSLHRVRPELNWYGILL